MSQGGDGSRTLKGSMGGFAKKRHGASTFQIRIKDTEKRLEHMYQPNWHTSEKQGNGSNQHVCVNEQVAGAEIKIQIVKSDFKKNRTKFGLKIEKNEK